MDVAKEAEVEALIKGVAERYGRLEVLVNNAGYGFAGTVVNTTEADWDALFAVNVEGVFFGCKHCHGKAGRGRDREHGLGRRQSRDQGPRRLRGIEGRRRRADTRHSDRPRQGAHSGECHCAGHDRVAVLHKDTVRTGRAELRRGLEMRRAMERLGQPIEIAKAILFLATEDSSFCTGTVLVADGGWTAG
ncbi:MAG: short-chain dehydrogenase [Rhodospirillales bacterium]|nr:short-chain dehydrogenase [Geminicoccaceae bacterium]MDF2767155.1 short-chain dehydrogenase [Rhodospirillales bacterium]